ncbi:nicotinamide-nucleotide adenylyltransferase, NadR type [Maridesulfovibrio ferrireducens]|uniref:Nicotinamide-nucleotide adenylyltransferase, NadR type n=2 Tax=Maridesulfovibrio ferrireducens TaxID=246191 RepID=A0A1G9K9Y0_9BACT|nr:nicotinamide-nucleotide adenylyltransferase, NadR type [Maridesulfovibrio ferrireducens]
MAQILQSGQSAAMPTRIVILGSECTGKTTLAAKIAEHFKVDFAPEYLREYFEMKNGHLTINDAIPIAKGQLEKERKLELKGYCPLLCDTDIITSIVYSKYYFGKCPDWIETEAMKRGSTHYLLCDIDVPWTADGQRDRPEEREYMQNLFLNELHERNLPFDIISGDIESRFNKSVTIINNLLHC